MYEVRLDRFKMPYLKWVQRFRSPYERGIWMEFGHSDEDNIEECIKINKEQGLDVLLDENGCYRALILKE